MATETLQGTEWQRARRWIATGRVGISSKTIWAVMTGEIPVDANQRCFSFSSARPWFDIPHDVDDFRRCYVLLTQLPEWRSRMTTMGTAFPKWRQIAAMWEELTALFEAEDYHTLYQCLRAVRDECMELDGWTKTGSGSWTRNDDMVTETEVPLDTADTLL